MFHVGLDTGPSAEFTKGRQLDKLSIEQSEMERNANLKGTKKPRSTRVPAQKKKKRSFGDTFAHQNLIQKKRRDGLFEAKKGGTGEARIPHRTKSSVASGGDFVRKEGKGGPPGGGGRSPLKTEADLADGGKRKIACLVEWGVS